MTGTAAAADTATVTTTEEAGSGLLGRVPMIVRVASHVVVWTAIIASVATELAHGWIPIGDNAAIASRASQTFSAHPPLVGMLSTASGNGHVVHGLGPLQLWLLAVPVHLDTAHGLLWGAGMLAGAVLSLSIEAAWSVGAWGAAGMVALVVADQFWRTPSVFGNIPWNAYFPVPFFVATLVLSWVVAQGAWAWWPVLVLTASVAAQAHVFFALPCLTLVVAAPLAGLAASGRPGHMRWLGAGCAVAAACWAAPLVQQVVGTPGNLSETIASQSGQAKLGLSFALPIVATLLHLPPLWLTAQAPVLPSAAAAGGAQSPVGGALVLVLLLVIAVLAWRSGRRSLALSAGVALVAAAGFTVGIAVVPQSRALTLFYLLDPLWPLAVMTWATVIWAGAALLTSARVVAWAPAGVAAWRSDQTVWRARRVLGLLVAAAAGVLTLAGLAGAARFTPAESTVSWNAFDKAQVVAIATAIERVAPRGPVRFEVGSGLSQDVSGIWVDEGVLWRLRADGWDTGQSADSGATTAPRLPHGTLATTVALTVDGTRITSIHAVRGRIP